jgi:hypothetical protein
METTIWICTGIICVVICFLGCSIALAVVRDITNALHRLEVLLEEIHKQGLK